MQTYKRKERGGKRERKRESDRERVGEKESERGRSLLPRKE
jgi:hypothetical protein